MFPPFLADNEPNVFIGRGVPELKLDRIGGFRARLVAYFVLLSLLPLAGAFWAFVAVADRSVTNEADARLEAGLRAALAAFEDERRSADAQAQTLARDAAFQRALAARDRTELARLLRPLPRLRLDAPGLRVGTAPARAAESRVALVGRRGAAAAVVASVPLDDRLIERLRRRSGLAREDELLLVSHSRVFAGGRSGQILGATPGHLVEATIGNERYRTVAVRLVRDRPVVLAAAAPRAAIDAQARSLDRRLFVALLALLLLVAFVAYLAGRSIVGSLHRLVAAANSIAEGRLRERVPVRGRDEFARLGQAFNEMADQLEGRLRDLDAERTRLRGSTARFGEALTATLDADQLLRVVVETAVDATGAVGGVLTTAGGERMVVGAGDGGATRMEFPLTAGRASFGILLLSGEAFGAEERMAAAALAGQAVVALENVRLHRLVERQALVDGLTGLSNRRHCDESIVQELARAGRFGGPVGLILADIDDFKLVNDRHGHPTGDEVLRAFAATLHDTVRDIDVPSRWGGEEFAVVLPGTDEQGAALLAERIRAAFEERPIESADGEPFEVTASFGVAAFPESATPAELVEGADAALYEAKRAGKNRVERRSEPVTGR